MEVAREGQRRRGGWQQQMREREQEACGGATCDGSETSQTAGTTPVPENLAGSDAIRSRMYAAAGAGQRRGSGGVAGWRGGGGVSRLRGVAAGSVLRGASVQPSTRRCDARGCGVTESDGRRRRGW